MLEKIKMIFILKIFLKFIGMILKINLSINSRLAINGQDIYCEKDRFILKDHDDNKIKTLVINQNSDNVDTKDRIAKYLANPLV